MDDTSTTGVYGPREIQNTSKKYMDGHINNINNSDAFKHVAEVPLFIQTLIQNVQKMASSLGLKNPKDYNKYRRETTNCCRLIQNYVAATIHGGLQTFPDTKFMVYMMANQFLDHNGKESTITIEAFTNLYLNDSSSNSASPLTNYKLPSDFEDAKLQYINNEEVMTETMFAIAEKETSDAYSETDKIEDMNAELRQYFNDFAQANSCLHTQLSNPNTIDLVGMIRHENGILLLQKLLINVSRNKTAGSIGTPFALKLKMDNILNNLIQFNIKARVNMLRYLFVFSNHNSVHSLLTVNILSLINKAFPNLTEDNMLKSAHMLADMNTNSHQLSLTQIDRLFSTIEDEVKHNKETKSFLIAKTEGSKSLEKSNNIKKASGKINSSLDKPCQACTYFEVLTNADVKDAPHHAKDCPNFTSKMLNKTWHYQFKDETMKTSHPDMPGTFNLREMNSNAAYKAKYALKPKLTPAQQPKPAQKQQK